MKFSVAFAALVALTVAVPLNKPVDTDLAQLEAIDVGPAIIAPPVFQPEPCFPLIHPEPFPPFVQPEPCPPLVHPEPFPPPVLPEPFPDVHPEPFPPVIQPEPIAIGPPIIAPLPDLGAVTAPVAPSPVVIGEIPAGASPLVQIIVNVNKATPDIPVSPIVRPELIVRPEPVGEIEIPVEPVQIVEANPEPVQVVEVDPVPVEPVQIGVPVIPEAAVILPEELN